jgi:nitrogen fixation protein FixH
MIQKSTSKIPYLIFIFFGIVIAVNTYYIYISQKTWRGVVTENSYKKGLNYNQTIAEVKKQKELGWKTKIKFTNQKNQIGILQVFLSDKNGKEIKDANVKVKLLRPTQIGFDFEENLEFRNKNYQKKIVFPFAGQWDFEIIVLKNDEVFQQVKRYVIIK